MKMNRLPDELRVGPSVILIPLAVNASMVRAKACGYYVNSILANREALSLGFDRRVLGAGAHPAFEAETAGFADDAATGDIPERLKLGGDHGGGLAG